MQLLAEFVRNHLSDDTSRLVLDRAKWPDIDMDIAVNSIESRRKLRGKVQEWYDESDLIFPRKLSAEQCSSSATALYKSSFAERIAAAYGPEDKEWKIADLTGGLGVDSWFFSKKASRVLYNEMLDSLCMAARHNFAILKATNIEISNHAVASPDDIMQDKTMATPSSVLTPFGPDIVYMDPARRGEGGRKVFLIEDCTPDVLTLKEDIFGICRHILLKLSPMADITMACSRLGKQCREVHVVASGGECKELLIWMDREWDAEYSIHAVELDNEGLVSDFTFMPSEEKETVGRFHKQGDVALYLFEPGKALMKSGGYNTISERFRIPKLGRSTHYYITDSTEKAEDLRKYGKTFRIISMDPLDKRTIKSVGNEFKRAEVTARNIPMDTDTLRKRLGVTSGGNTHIFGLKSDYQGNLLLVTSTV